MSTILEQRTQLPLPRRIAPGSQVSEILRKSGGFGDIRLGDGSTVSGSCIRCPHVPCIQYSPSELRVPGFEDFPADLNSAVCPTDAIAVDTRAAAPVVSKDRCIGCGLCADRCPVAAIRLTDEPKAEVNVVQDDVVFPVAKSIKEVDATHAMLAAATQRGALLAPSDASLSGLVGAIETIGDFTLQFPNHLCRNLLLQLGIPTAMRRRGDVNLRMDLVFRGGVSEVEFSRQALLDSPRNVLDNVAVIVSRYGKDKAQLVPLIISIGLPNKRAEYWQVINDAENVLGIKIRSLSVGALCILLWSGRAFSLEAGRFCTDPSTCSIRADIDHFTGQIQVSSGLLGILESSK